MCMTNNLKGRARHSVRAVGVALALVLAIATLAPAAGAEPTAAATNAAGLVPLKLTLPAPAFKGTPKDVQFGANVEPLSTNARPPLLVPAGLKNLAPAAKITCSDSNASPDMLAKIVDGNKEAYDDSIIILRKGLQYVQFDLGAPREIFAIVIWHAHNAAKVYHDVVVQVSDDPQFKTQVQTLFNNDADNTAGLGIGTDREYFETAEGRLIDARGVKARYVRCYSKGSTESVLNEYTEVEIYGRPAP